MTNAEDPLEAFMQYRPDLLLLDLDGPGSNGLEVCQQMRAQSSVPIIVLSSNGREYDKVRAFDLGADDYVCTPFGVQELLARVRVALRHAARLPSGLRPMFTAGSLTIDIEQRLVLIHGQEVKLTPTEDERIAIHTPYVVPLVLDPHPHSLFAHIFREGAEKGTSLFAS